MESQNACGRRREGMRRYFGADDVAGVTMVLRERRADLLTTLLRQAFAFLSMRLGRSRKRASRSAVSTLGRVA